MLSQHDPLAGRPCPCPSPTPAPLSTRRCYERGLSQTKVQMRIEEIKRILASRASRTQDDIDVDDDFDDEIDDATAAAIFNAVRRVHG